MIILRQFSIFFFIFYLVLTTQIVFAQQEQTKLPLKILFVNSWNKGMPWQTSVEKGLQSGLNLIRQPYQLYLEYLDAGRFTEKSQQIIFSKYIEGKFSCKKIDVIIAEGFPASGFLRDIPEFCPGLKRLYVNPGAKSGQWETDSSENELIIPLLQDYRQAIAEMIRLLSPKKIYIVADAFDRSGVNRLNATKIALSSYKDKYETEYLLNLPQDELLSKVSNLPPNSIIFYLPILQYGKGQRTIPYKVASLIVEHANAPVMSKWASLMGSGILGGYLLSGEQVGKIAAKSLDTLINGKKITPGIEKAYEYIYDWRQLRRWNIKTERLPETSIVKYRSPTILDEYYKEAVFLFCSLLMMVLLLIALIIVNQKRKIALSMLKHEHALLEQRVLERTIDLNKAKLLAEKQARTDPLTGLNNRRRFFESGQILIDQTKRYQRSLSVMMLDIDFFKKVNDTYGHAFGDIVLKMVAQKIFCTIRTSDIAGRIGGEEFAVMLPESKPNKVQNLANRLRKAIEDETVKAEKEVIKVTMSIGISEYREKESSIEEALSRADEALYQAKEQGRNRVVVYESQK